MNLSDPFPVERVSWRVGSTTADKKRGMALAYIDARDVMERLDEVVGSENWQDEYHRLGEITICRIAIRKNGEWVWKSDGAGDTDFEAEKGALSSAFKRAAVKWGIGRYLYDIASPWVAILPAGRSFKIDENEMPKLWTILGGTPEKETRAKANGSETKYTRMLNAAITHADRARGYQDRLRQEDRIDELDAMACDIEKEQAYINLPQQLKNDIAKTYAECLSRLSTQVVHDSDDIEPRPTKADDFDPEQMRV